MVIPGMPEQQMQVTQGVQINLNAGEALFHWAVVIAPDGVSHIFASLTPIDGGTPPERAPRTCLCGLDFDMDTMPKNIGGKSWEDRYSKVSCPGCKESFSWMAKVLNPDWSRYRNRRF